MERYALSRAAGIVAAAVLLLGLSLPGAASAQDTRPARDLEGKIVRRITFIGLTRLSPEAVKDKMTTREGKRFSSKIVTEDMKNLVRENVFFNIFSVKWEPFEDGVAITFYPEENPRVLEVVFIGAIEIERADLVPLVETRRGGLTDAFTLDNDAAALRRHYRSKGYHFVEVEHIEQHDELGVIVMFRITEGPEVKIEDIVFEGVRSFEEDELIEAMPTTNEGTILARTPYVHDSTLADIVSLQQFYRGHGFLDARVTLRDVHFSATRDDAFLFIHVEEGRAYTVRSLEIRGLTLFTPEEFLPEMKTCVGARYEPGFALADDRKRIRDRYIEFAYNQCNPKDASLFRPETCEVDVILDVEEGRKEYVGDIVITGNVRTQDRVIRREIDLYTGEPLNAARLARARSRLVALQYFDTVEAFGGRREDAPISVKHFDVFREAYVTLQDTRREDVKDIVVSVKEKDTGRLRFGFGVSSNNGLVGDITYHKANFDPFDWPESFSKTFDAFTGGGQFLTLSAQPGTELTRFRLTWGNPRIFDSAYGLTVDFFKAYRARENWIEDRIGFRVTVGRQFGPDVGVSLQYRFDLVDVDRIDSDAPQIVFDFEGENLISALRLAGRINRLDNYTDPTSGYLVDLSFEHAGLGGDIHFNRVVAESELYILIARDAFERAHVVRISGQAGWMEEFDPTVDIPVYERFFAGGTGTIRGFRFRGIGPTDNGDPVGGKALLLGSIEYAYPLLSNVLRGVLFLDAGTVASSWSSSEIGDIRVTVGFGLRIVIPFLGPKPFALDFGFPIITYDGDEERILSFSFGSNF